MTTELIAERETTHGDFKDNTRIAQALKRLFQNSPNWRAWELSEMQKESLDMIAHKLSRILAGDPNYRDHWDDIAGYAQLIARTL